jgi:hypothetical protein
MTNLENNVIACSPYFPPYTSVEDEALQECAKALSRLSKTEIRDVASSTFMSYFQLNDLPEFSIRLEHIEGVQDAVAVVTFSAHPMAENIAGLAKLAKSPSDACPIAIIYLMPDRNEWTLDHEKIHICQYLLRNTYPLTKEERALYLYYPGTLDICLPELVKNDNDAAFQYLISVAAYKTWIELEANFFTTKPSEGATITFLDTLYNAYHSAHTIFTIEGGMEITGGEMAVARDRMVDFLGLLQNEVSWVGEGLSAEGKSSLHDELLQIHDEVETDLMFGTFDEEEMSDFDDS